MWSAVVPLMCRERFTGFSRSVIHKLIALTGRHPFGRGNRQTGRRSGLEPRLAAIVRTLNDLSKPAAGLRRVYAVRIHGRTLNVIDLPSGKVRPTDVPFFAFSIGGKNKCALTGAYKYSYIAHIFVPSL